MGYFDNYITDINAEKQKVQKSIDDQTEYLKTLQSDSRGKTDTLWNEQANTNIFETPQAKSILDQYKIKGNEAKAGELSAGVGVNAGNLDSFAVANGLRQQGAMTDLGNKTVIDANNSRVSNLVSILNTIGANIGNTQNFIGAQGNIVNDKNTMISGYAGKDAEIVEAEKVRQAAAVEAEKARQADIQKARIASASASQKSVATDTEKAYDKQVKGLFTFFEDTKKKEYAYDYEQQETAFKEKNGTIVGFRFDPSKGGSSTRAFGEVYRKLKNEFGYSGAELESAFDSFVKTAGASATFAKSLPSELNRLGYR